MNSTAAPVTICVVPRERFSCAVGSLKNLIANTSDPYKLIYIDGNSPAEIAQQLAEICAEQGFAYHREDTYLSPNAARNLALQFVDTPFVAFVAFVDNDLYVDSGWLENLLQCARDTGAWAVTPTVLEGEGSLQVIHLAGGDLIEERANGFNRIHQRHRYMKQPLRNVAKDLRREAVGSFEFHCVLLRTDVFAEKTFLDEGFLSHQEHLDLAREIRRAGGNVYFEPKAIVRYDNARPFEQYDQAYFELRWGEEWTMKSIEHAREKWGLAPNDEGLEKLAMWTSRHRRLFQQSQRSWKLHTLPLVAKRSIGAWLRKRKLLPDRSPF